MHTVKPQTRTLRTNINSQGNEANITKKPHLHKNILYHAFIALCVFAHYVGEKNLFGMYNAFPPEEHLYPRRSNLVPQLEPYKWN